MRATDTTSTTSTTTTLSTWWRRRVFIDLEHATAEPRWHLLEHRSEGPLGTEQFDAPCGYSYLFGGTFESPARIRAASPPPVRDRCEVCQRDWLHARARRAA